MSDQITGRLSAAIPLVLLLEERLKVKRFPFPSVQRSNALVDFFAKVAKPFDMRQKLTTNLLLVGIR